MNTRNKIALGIQQGACNPRPIANELVKAIDECRAEGINPNKDAACFLILHQLTWVLAGHDIACDYSLSERYSKAYAEVESK